MKIKALGRWHPTISAEEHTTLRRKGWHARPLTCPNGHRPKSKSKGAMPSEGKKLVKITPCGKLKIANNYSLATLILRTILVKQNGVDGRRFRDVDFFSGWMIPIIVELRFIWTQTEHSVEYHRCHARLGVSWRDGTNVQIRQEDWG